LADSASKSTMRRILFLSLDGMTDPLGQSQVLPYLAGLAARGHQLWLMSCEKKERFEEGRANIEAFCQQHHISWHPQPYLRKPRGLATIIQVRRMFMAAMQLHQEHTFDATHCRSYIPALVGLKLKRQEGLPFVFDMRGFWADERVEGGLWDMKKPWYAWAYHYMKRKEKAFLTESKHVVSLTHAGKKIIEEMNLSQVGGISVIPCSVDLEAFADEQRGRLGNEVRLQLGIAPDALVFVYLGSVGSWYMLEEMLLLLKYVKRSRPESHLLFISHSPPDLIRGKAAELGLPEDAFTIKAAGRKEIPALLRVGDIGLFFIKPCFSKQASSPTKLGEMLAMGLPIITNGGVGDLDDFFAKNEVGKLISSFEESHFEAVSRMIPEMLDWDKGAIRAVAEAHFSLEDAVDVYDEIYQGLV